MFDVIIVGGSFAGLAAALQLGRARRQVLILDAGARRNRFASHSHGFLGQDGQSPDAIAAAGRADVLAYPTVTWRDARATQVRAIAGGFAVSAGAEEFRAKRLILATGVVDALPDLPGLTERWGKSVFHCPYCHGYELALGRIGVLATSPHAFHFATLVSEWAGPGQCTVFLQGASEPDEATRAQLAARNIRLERDRIASVEGEAPAITALLRDGRRIELDGLFVPSSLHLDRAFADQLGCELEMGPAGAYYKTDAMKETTVPGVFACGDAATPMGTVTFAVADGARAGIAAHQTLVFRPAS